MSESDGDNSENNEDHGNQYFPKPSLPNLGKALPIFYFRAWTTPPCLLGACLSDTLRISIVKPFSASSL